MRAAVPGRGPPGQLPTARTDRLRFFPQRLEAGAGQTQHHLAARVMDRPGEGKDPEVPIGQDDRLFGKSWEQLLTQGGLALGLGAVLGPPLRQQGQATFQLIGHHQMNQGPGGRAVLIGRGGKSLPQHRPRLQGEGGAIQDKDPPLAKRGGGAPDQSLHAVLEGPMEEIELQAGSRPAVAPGGRRKSFLLHPFARGQEGRGALGGEVADGIRQGGIVVEPLVNHQVQEDQGRVGGLAGAGGVQLDQVTGEQLLQQLQAGQRGGAGTGRRGRIVFRHRRLQRQKKAPKGRDILYSTRLRGTGDQTGKQKKYNKRK